MIWSPAMVGNEDVRIGEGSSHSIEFKRAVSGQTSEPPDHEF
jgi:hypothetical protein